MKDTSLDLVVVTTVLLLLEVLIFNVIEGDLILRPSEAMVLINQSSYFNCSTNIKSVDVHWYHYPVGADVHERNSVYAHGKMYKPYTNDFEITEALMTNGIYNLVIRSAKPQYAGRYECIDNGGLGNSSSAELIVLNKEPSCKSNIEEDGIIGPNTCGLKPEELQLSCSVAYKGNFHPPMVWKEVGGNDSITLEVTPFMLEGHAIYNASRTAALSMNRSSYVCQSTMLTLGSFICTVRNISVLYIYNHSEVLEKAIGDNVNCSANTSSQSCSYKWKWFSDEDLLTMSNNHTLKIDKPGMYKCEAVCKILQISCKVIASLVNVSEISMASTTQASTNMTATEATTVMTTVLITVGVVIIIIIGAVIIILVTNILLKYRKGKPQRNDENTNLENEMTDVPMNETDPGAITVESGVDDAGEKEMFLVKSEFTEPKVVKAYFATTEEIPKKRKRTSEDFSSNSSEEAEAMTCSTTIWPRDSKKPIAGFAILMKELFIVTENSSEMDVYHSMNADFQGSLLIEGLDNPSDMTSCSVNNCLYLSMTGKIFRVHPRGAVMQIWNIEYDDSGCLSLTHELNVILSVWKRNCLKEFTEDGNLIQTVQLPSDIHPFHAIKLTSSHFVIGYGSAELNHNVCIASVYGDILRTFEGMLNFPKHLTVCRGSIIVADQGNHRVLLINHTLESCRELLSVKDGISRPVRLCMDNPNNRLFVADNERENNKVLAFKLPTMPLW